MVLLTIRGAALLAMLLLIPVSQLRAEAAVDFTDSTGARIVLEGVPQRVVSLVPSVTEMLFQLGLSDRVYGITHHDTWPAETAGKEVMGGFFRPDVERVRRMKPDAVCYADIHADLVQELGEEAVLISLTPSSIPESFDHIRLLGRLFDREARAEEIIAEQQRQLEVIRKKTAAIPDEKKLRTVRLMGRDRIMTPGDDSFQNEYIELAGGVPPRFGKDGSIIAPTLEQWQEFNPEVIYGCGNDRQLLPILSEPGWGDVDAVRNNRIMFFPCELTCRASTHAGYFTSWLAARLYNSEFSDPAGQVLADSIVSRKEVKLDYEYVQRAERVDSDILDFRNKSLVLSFSRPMTILSTLEGWRDNIETVGNHYFPPPSWGLGHGQGLDGLRRRTFGVLGLDGDKTSLLFTGADMDNLAIATVSYRDMRVTALVTAGVKGNAVRMSQDEGAWYEWENQAEEGTPGTINALVLTNASLSPRAMTRALISAVEAKSAALQDLDIRSSANPDIHAATGTGTDNIIVVRGSGPEVDNAGGHTKMGELIASAVYKGVVEAIGRQNGIAGPRTVFTRLADRGTSPWELSTQCGFGSELAGELEKLLLEPVYANFIAAAMAISDDYERGLIDDLEFFAQWCSNIAAAVAGKEVDVVQDRIDNLPKVMDMAYSALITGLEKRTP